MKPLRHILTLLVLTATLSLAAQQHAIFLGIPLGGERESFVDSLEARGYQLEDWDEDITTFKGMFDGVGALVEVHSTPRSHTVHQVTVYFTEIQGNEIGLYMKTRQIRKALSRKYSSWLREKQKDLEEWSSTYARVSLGKVRLQGDPFKTIFVRWQDRSGWEILQREK